MAYVNSSRAVSFADRFAAMQAAFADAIAKRNLYRTTVNELSALTDRELADLGMHRPMITRIALDAVKAN